MKQILIVEDDSFLNKMLSYNLTADGYGVTSALNYRTAAEAIRQREFDLILLDVNLPDGSGFDLCKLVKPNCPDAIVIFLTANDQESDQIRGYEVGAVDYITKPFDMKEVIARVQIQLRHAQKQNGTVDIPKQQIKHKKMLLDKGDFSIAIGDVTLSKITKQEFAILELLMGNPKQVFSKEAIFEYAWEEPYIGETKTLDVHISNIRKKIRTVTEEEYIETVWGVGYRFRK